MHCPIPTHKLCVVNAPAGSYFTRPQFWWRQGRVGISKGVQIETPAVIFQYLLAQTFVLESAVEKLIRSKVSFIAEDKTWPDKDEEKQNEVISADRKQLLGLDVLRLTIIRLVIGTLSVFSITGRQIQY